ncbi:hypothetical protein Pan258_54330 [Symmachiella dynata]|uniref:hypothetical protein n=1 Tax=Symmachiella dynata TaxID=2527995 RepID=UPI001188BEB0|nr:hypothetical protein [Symmachiella dynata]QDT51344.1 hypothetical protein Pan258_54330 [Symmachiella dynata]
MNTSIPDSENDAFEAASKQHFAFLESEYGFRFAGMKEVAEAPRDSYVVAKYWNNDIRIDVAWNAMAMSVGVLIRRNDKCLSRRERYIYLEPFIEFASDGSVTPVIPQIYPGMSVSKIKGVMGKREKTFGAGLDQPIRAISERLKKYLSNIRDASSDVVRQYHQWYHEQGRHG